VRPYLAILSVRFRQLLQYRAAAIAGIGTQFFWGLIRMMIFIAFYENASSDVPMDLQTVIAYVWLGQAVILLVPFRFDAELEQMIRSGSVAYEMLRPVDLYNFWYSRAIASRIAPTLMRCIPIIIVAGIAGWIYWPGIASFTAGLACIAAALLIGSALGTIMTITMFWTISGRGISIMIAWIGFFASGMILPIPLFPEWAQVILNALPFRALIDLPFRMMLGHIPVSELPVILAQQLGWAVGLYLFGRWLLSRAVSKLVIQGG
jgi:ABC-2 type transport system permease protein